MQDVANTTALLSIGESSEYLGISIDTLRRWEKKGKLISLRSPGGHRYFKKDDLDQVFGKKYERDTETKPRNITANKEEELIIQRVNQEEQTTPPIITNINSPEVSLSSQSFPVTSEDFPNLFSSSELTAFQPSSKEIKIPDIPLIQVKKNEYINTETNTTIDNKIEQQPETSKVSENQTQDNELPPANTRKELPSNQAIEETLPVHSADIFTPEDKILEPPDLTRVATKRLETKGSKTLYVIGLIVTLLVIAILTYLYIQIPDTPLSPIP